MSLCEDNEKRQRRLNFIGYDGSYQLVSPKQKYVPSFKKIVSITMLKHHLQVLHIKPELHYQGKYVLGNALNQEETSCPATSMLAF